MRYLLLAAGEGTRLHPLTSMIPKCLFKLDNQLSVIDRMVDLIKKYDDTAEIIVVAGYMFEKLKEEVKDVVFVRNPFFSITNSIASLWFAKDYLEGEVVIINADVVTEERLVKDYIVKSSKESCVLIDSSVKVDGDYNVQIDGDKIVVMSKDLKEYFGEYVGITKIAKKDINIFRNEICNMVNNGYYDQWYENALVQLIFNSNFDLKYIDVKDYQWTEIDYVDDLIKAKKIHRGG